MTDKISFDASSLFDLRGQVAIVTGAARGNGRAIAEGLASVGVCVVLVDILEQELREVEELIKERGQKAVAVPGDLCCPAELENLVEQTIKEFGRVDILVNCAGVTIDGCSEDYTEETWKSIHNINVMAPFRLSKLVAKHMIRQKSGNIINITSICAAFGFPNNPAYQASKGALRQLTRAMANDWAKHNIRVNNLSPGYFKTEMTKKSRSNPEKAKERAKRWMLKRWAEPEELVGPVIFLASQASSFMTGSDLNIDGGFSATGITG